MLFAIASGPDVANNDYPIVAMLCDEPQVYEILRELNFSTFMSNPSISLAWAWLFWYLIAATFVLSGCKEIWWGKYLNFREDNVKGKKDVGKFSCSSLLVSENFFSNNPGLEENLKLSI